MEEGEGKMMQLYFTQNEKKNIKGRNPKLPLVPL